ncbi:hypothetical protein HRI_000598200 [Hibiscus trionum]|uniref:Uncharacterized protein n=1 Tax=Hibiscus trionum TaxID=183268 RepID=A0A9W7LLZ4_HIBTR|nr:hypothetical protein HRI_000598200 [Hibiscus trionum]
MEFGRIRYFFSGTPKTKQHEFEKDTPQGGPSRQEVGKRATRILGLDHSSSSASVCHLSVSFPFLSRSLIQRTTPTNSGSNPKPRLIRLFPRVSLLVRQRFVFEGETRRVWIE